MNQSFFHTLILGGGASGLMCARLLGQAGKTVGLLEHNGRVGKKILVSGGGRCNFTNQVVESADFRSLNPHFSKSALSRFGPERIIQLLDSHNISYTDKGQGQLFCTKNALELVKALEADCRQASVQIFIHHQVDQIERTAQGVFQVTSGNQVFQANHVVVATGGLAYPKLGATDQGLKIARQFGLKTTQTDPALVPLLHPGFAELSGLSVAVEIEADGQSVADDLLFTHRGFSGPAILKASLDWKPGQEIRINFLPQVDCQTELQQQRTRQPKKTLAAWANPHLPERMAKVWLTQVAQVEKTHLGELSNAEITQLAQQLNHWSFTPRGTEGYQKAEVMRGGVSTRELSSSTLEAKKVPGLFFIGEVVDVTGLLGGFNFQWAWSSAAAAAEELQTRLVTEL